MLLLGAFVSEFRGRNVEQRAGSYRIAGFGHFGRAVTVRRPYLLREVSVPGLGMLSRMFMSVDEVQRVLIIFFSILKIACSWSWKLEQQVQAAGRAKFSSERFKCKVPWEAKRPYASGVGMDTYLYSSIGHLNQADGWRAVG